ncbi:MAG: outer membrane protein transport protein [Devosiaceae bacterium]|nr:outer membrane protein transport protein [Devosiaceae bacterium MH13]
MAISFIRSAGLVGAASVLALTASAAHAGGFALREQSSYYQGTSFAGSAAGATLSSMFWNPAALGMVGDGFTNEAVFNFIVPTSEVTVTGVGDQGDIGVDAFVPGSYGAYRINERIAIGFSTNGPFGLATKYPMGSAVRNVAGTSEVFSLNVAPTIAYSLSDTFTVALGAQIQYMDVRYTNNLLSLAGDDIGFGFTAGVLWEPLPGTTVGLGFRSSVGHELEGDASGAALGGATVPISIEDFNTPEIVTLSVEQRITDAFRVSATAEWTNWSRVGTYPVLSGGTQLVVGGGTNVAVPLEYEDGWYFAIGGEFDATEDLTLRAGIGYELSPVTDSERGLRLPDNDRLWLSAGLSYQVLDSVRLDAGYTYISVTDTDIPSTFAGNQSSALGLAFGGTADADVHIFTVGLNAQLEHGIAGLFGGH